MALDIIARAAAASANSSAAAAQAASASALAATAPPFLFTAIASKTIDSAINAVISSGYSASGTGAGNYVSDSLATSALAAAHPRFCKQSANGRYFRLVPFGADNAISVEQGGALGAVGTDERPAIQSAIDYAITVGITEVRFMHKAYTAKCGTRVAGGFGNINPSGDMITINGALAPAPCSIKLTGLTGGTTITMIGYNTGGSTDTDYQTFEGNPWRGGGIQLYGTQYDDTDNYFDQDKWAIQCFEMENITISGGRTVGGKTATSIDTSNKGIFTFNATRKIVLKNGGIEYFGHELLYGGGTGYGSGTLYPMTVHMENFKGLHSGHSCLNFQDVNLTDINGEYGDAYIAAEQYGHDSRFIGTVFRDANQLNFSASDRSLLGGWSGLPGAHPAQSAALRKTMLEGVTTRNVNFVRAECYTYGNLHIIDGQLTFNDYSMAIDLDVTHTIDQFNHWTAVTLYGPGALPAGASAGFFPRDINVRLKCNATPHALNAGYDYTSILQWSGYLDPDTCVFTFNCSVPVSNAATVSNSPRHSMPKIIFEKWTPTSSNTNLVPGYSTGGVTASALDPTNCGATLYPAGTAGGEEMTFGTIGSGGAYEGFAHGQEFHFCHGSGSGRFNFAKNGTGMALTRTRACFQAGDRITFTYDKRLDKWVDVVGHTSDVLEASATYSAPSIAAGGSTTTTVTVAGAAIGDTASASLGISTAGLQVSASVTAANTVTVVLANLTGAAVDLASTTLWVTVSRR